jgi:7-keto-8-aminopelargonate synthetase-like enzyme
MFVYGAQRLSHHLFTAGMAPRWRIICAGIFERRERRGCRRQETQEQHHHHHQSADLFCSSFLCNTTIFESFLTTETYIIAHRFPKPISCNAQGN